MSLNYYVREILWLIGKFVMMMLRDYRLFIDG